MMLVQWLCLRLRLRSRPFGQELPDRLGQPVVQLGVVRIGDLRDSEELELPRLSGPVRSNVGLLLGVHDADRFGPSDILLCDPPAAWVWVGARGAGLAVAPVGDAPGERLE